MVKTLHSSNVIDIRYYFMIIWQAATCIVENWRLTYTQVSSLLLMHACKSAMHDCLVGCQTSSKLYLFEDFQ